MLDAVFQKMSISSFSLYTQVISIKTKLRHPVMSYANRNVHKGVKITVYGTVIDNFFGTHIVTIKYF